MQPQPDRRRYPRLAAPVYYRPAGPAFLHHRRATVDVSLGGMRVYTDEKMKVGARLEVDLLLGGERTARCWMRIAWIEKMSATSGAAYDVGLELTDIEDEDRRLLASALAAGR